MSERPENPQDENTPLQGGWHSPREATPWQTPETEASQKVAWREMKALPDDVEEEPSEKGMWHLPKETDTTFSAEDVVEITDEPRKTPTSSIAAPRPEDLIAEIVGRRQSTAPNPEDFDFGSLSRDEAETIAADAIEEGATLLVDEEDLTEAMEEFEDDESFTQSEYMALAMLAQGDDDDLAGLNAGDLSPAEQALYSAALNTANEMDSQRVSEPPVGDDATVTMDDTGELTQAQKYAREQLAQLGGSDDEGAETFGGTQQPAQQEPQQQQRQYTQEEIQLAQQFRETQRQVAVLRQQRDQGMVDQSQLQAMLQQYQLYVNGKWWMVGLDSGDWFTYNEQTGEWEPATPPVPLNAGQDTMTETGVGDVVGGSLPYLPNDGTQNTEYSDQTQYDYDNTQYSTAQQQYNEQYGVDDNVLRNPNQPVRDPNLTQVGSSFDLDNLPYSDPTVQNIPTVGDMATMPSDAFQGQQTVQSASFNDVNFDDNYGQGVPSAEPVYQAGPQAAPSLEELRDDQNASLFALLGIGAVGLIVVVGLVIGGFLFFAQNEYSRIISEWEAEIAALGTQNFDFQTATILAADGTVIAELTGEEGARTIVSIENGDVSPFFVHAIVASEDPRFYENAGVDPLAIGRAFFQNYFAGEVESGASTITQQIVRERILGSNVVTLDRKFLEALIAIEVASSYSKNQILDIYINEFFYGEQSYGVEAAAEFYFNTTAAELDAAQAATLAGILPSPSSTNPVVAPAEAFSNMRVILNRMIEVNCLNFQHGEWAVQGVPFCVSEDTLVSDSQGNQVPLYRRNPDGTFGGFLALQIAQVETRRYEPRQTDIQYPHFVFYVLGQLDSAYGRGAYIERGFTVQTTLIPRIQNTAEAALQQGVNQLALSGVQTGAVVVLDPQTGAIVSMVGSPDFNNEEIDGQNNNTLSLQQPGSAIKPVVYATSLTGVEGNYFTPASILWDVPSQYDIGGSVYAPTNFDGQYRGPVGVRFALAQSLNVPAIKTYNTFGTQAFINTATQLGIVFDPDPTDDVAPTFGLPTAIGATEVSLLDLTQAYATIANDGVRNNVFSVVEITERGGDGTERPVELLGNLVHDQTTQAISAQVAYLLQNILSDDTARSAVINGIRSSFPANSNISGAAFGLQNQNQVAAKTGTNNATANGNPSRLWTVGFSNNYAVGVWLGSLNQGTPLTGRVTGFTGASPVWTAVMAEALGGQNPGAFNNPGGVVQDSVCQLTGTLAPQQTTTCPNRLIELYVQTQPPPPQEAGFVATIAIDSWTGLRANQWCAENVINQTYSNIQDPFATGWLTGTTQGRNILGLLNLPTDLQAPPANECQQSQPLPTVIINFPQENTPLEGNVVITGQINAQSLARWELQITEVGTDNFRSIMPQPRTDQITTSGQSLYEWDSTTVQNGAYILRLAVFSQNGGFINREVRVTVNNPEPTPVPPTPTPIQVQIETPLPFDPPTPNP